MTTRPTLNIERTGSGPGPTVIASHGVGSDTKVWATLAPGVGAHRPFVAWDQPGHGLSEKAADDDAYGPALAYASLVSVADAGAGSPVILLGHSLGGYLSCRYAIEHPERVSALILIATGPGFRSPDAREKWNADVRRGAEKQGRPETLVGLHEDSFVMDHLADIACPALVIVGSNDAAFVGATDYIERKVPGIERITIDDAGHMVPETHGEILSAHINDFLARRL
jgi:pimeloyl-ACP methyl ester carboxylesterase